MQSRLAITGARRPQIDQIDITKLLRNVALRRWARDGENEEENGKLDHVACLKKETTAFTVAVHRQERGGP